MDFWHGLMHEVLAHSTFIVFPPLSLEHGPIQFYVWPNPEKLVHAK